MPEDYAAFGNTPPDISRVCFVLLHTSPCQSTQLFAVRSSIRPLQRETGAIGVLPMRQAVFSAIFKFPTRYHLRFSSAEGVMAVCMCSAACGGLRRRRTSVLNRAAGIKDDCDGRSCDCVCSALLKPSIPRSDAFRMFRTDIVGD
jgi:hypothetical protein